MNYTEKEIDENRQGEALMIEHSNHADAKRKMYIESYGCAMNFSDSEIVASILSNDGFVTTKNMEEADIILVNTCAIRDNAEQRIRGRLKEYKAVKKHNPELVVGVMGCMAERLKTKLLEEEKLVDIVVGPDAYRDLPNLINRVDEGQKAVNVLLSREETYAEIAPVRLNSNGISAFISIMRGCDNMCAFCVVPFTRGRERSRDPKSIVEEARQLVEQGYKEVTLLGQNVDSYLWAGGGLKKDALEKINSGALKSGETVDFAQLLEMIALVSPELRVRFSTSHPKDINDNVLYTMAKYENICKYVHLPVQSGSTRILELMNRGYSREWYMDKVRKIREIMPDCAISMDMISGFCSETEEDHQDSLSLMEWVGFEYAYMFKYSERPGTQAAKKMEDDVPEEIKTRRLQEIIDLQQRLSLTSNRKDVGKTFKVLVENTSKRSNDYMSGRNSQNKVIIFPKGNLQKGQYVNVKVTECTPATLLGEVVE